MLILTVVQEGKS